MSAWIPDKVHIDLMVALALHGPRDHEGTWTFTWKHTDAAGHRCVLETGQTRTGEHPDNDGDGSRLPIFAMSPDVLGQLLTNEVVRSVRARYPMDRPGDEPGPRPAYWAEDGELVEDGYIYEDPCYRVTKVEAGGLVRCYGYQACEHDEWEVSEAHIVCEALQDAADCRDDSYLDQGPWGWSERELETARKAAA